MEKNKKKQLMVGVIAIVLLIVATVGVTYAFFNYTRTGSQNILAVGRIYFKSTNGTSINLTNVFPVKSTELEGNTNVGSVTVSIEGDTTYDDGIEYLISASDVVNTVNSKEVPIGIRVTATDLGTGDDSYFDNRGGSSPIYKVLAKDTIENNEQLVVGYIPKGNTGVNGSITVKAFVDGDKIAISDTYDGTESSNMGTTNDWVGDRTVLTTTEWNSLSSVGISFQVKVEANEGFWVEEERTLADVIISKVGNDGIVAINTSGAVVSSDDTIREYRYSGGGRYCEYENGGTTYKFQIEGDSCPNTIEYGGGYKELYSQNSDINKYFSNLTSTTLNLKSGTGIQEGTVKNYILFNNELWRIIGVFNGKIKIIKDLPIKTEDAPINYTNLNGKTFQINQGGPSGTKYAPIRWNYDGTNYPNDWANGGLQYWLNENNTGSYYNTIGTAYKSIIQDDTYYLSNVYNGSWGTASQVYDEERATAVECASSITSSSHNNSCNIWNGNASTWEGKIALPYPSDYGYAADSRYYEKNIDKYYVYNSNDIQSDNWLLNTDSYILWFLSPSSDGNQEVTAYQFGGWVRGAAVWADARNSVRPVLSLNESVLLKSGDGSYLNPYTLKLN